MKAATELGAHMLTIHASGGSAMLRAATRSLGRTYKPSGVTVLTSLSDEDMQEIGVSGRVFDQVLRMAAFAQSCRLPGNCCLSVRISMVRKALGEGLAIVTPGIRPAGAETNDQQRIATPAQAISNGASHIVIGRPITHAPDPAKAAQAIISEMEQAKNSR